MSSTTTQKFSMPTTVQEANQMGVSLCIPRVFNNINHRRIKQWFIKNLRQWGFIDRVDLVPVFKQENKFINELTSTSHLVVSI